MRNEHHRLLQENRDLKKQIAALTTKIEHSDSLVQQMIDLNKKKRINWKILLGVSLTQKIEEYYKKGFTKSKTYTAIAEILKSKNISDWVFFDRLQINVHARYGENKSKERVK